jgi:hypothetical protein
MPCQYFEPQRRVAESAHAHARLPLIDEYEGLCRASRDLAAVPADLRFRCCNHGNSRGVCPQFPLNEPLTSSRYHAVRLTAAALEVLRVEERDYAPVAWQTVIYARHNEQLSPAAMEECVKAQTLAFCRSYLKRFPDP